jgi:hypothetical protein
MELGEIQLDEDNEGAVLRIGNHLLRGKVVTLGKPLAVIPRCKSGEQLLEIRGVIRRKILFNSRPVPSAIK